MVMGYYLEVVVFPAPAGVFLYGRQAVCLGRRLPRACGGVSAVNANKLNINASSPRLRGCFIVTALM